MMTMTMMMMMMVLFFVVFVAGFVPDLLYPVIVFSHFDKKHCHLL